MQNILDIIDGIGAENPYKIPGMPETYEKYNEGWCDCCNRIASKLEEYLSDKVIVDKNELINEVCKNSKKMSEIKPPHKYYKAISTNKMIELLQEKK